MKGSLEVIAGSMWAGKSEELIRRLVRARIAKKSVIVFKPVIDNRYSETEIASHSGQKFECYAISNSQSILKICEELSGAWYFMPDIVAVDEAQFFDNNIFKVIDKLIDRNVRVIVAGLDQDFRGEGFGPMPELLSRADSVLKLSAICTVCGEEARKTQRLINGKPAPFSGETVIVGANEQYEARCRNCYQKG